MRDVGCPWQFTLMSCDDFKKPNGESWDFRLKATDRIFSGDHCGNGTTGAEILQASKQNKTTLQQSTVECRKR